MQSLVYMKPIVSRLSLLLFHGFALLLLLLAIYVRQLPPTIGAIPDEGSAEARWWGMWPVTYLPTWLFVCGVVVIVSTIAVILYQEQHWERTVSQQRQDKDTTSVGRQYLYLLLILGLVYAFYALPIVHTRWGDAYILTKAIAHPDPAIQLTHSWQAPLDLFLHSQVWQQFHETRGWRDAMPVYHLLSPVAGLLYLLAAWAVSRTSARQMGVPQWLSFALLTSIGVMQLFFGYIENYSFAAAGILLYLWLALLTLSDKSPLWLATLTLAISNTFHPSTIVYWPSLVWLTWHLMHVRNNQRAHLVYQFVMPPFVIGLALLMLMELGDHGIVTLLTTDRPGGGDARWLVPLWSTTTRWERYTMFSWAHLRDIVNEQLLVGPILLPTLFIIGLLQIYNNLSFARNMNRSTGNGTALWTVGSKSGQDDRQEYATIVFLALATACHLLLTWIWNPDYGGQRDWDLFSLSAVPLALLTAHLLWQRIAHPQRVAHRLIPLLMLQYAQLATWVYQNTLPWEWP